MKNLLTACWDANPSSRPCLFYLPPFSCFSFIHFFFIGSLCKQQHLAPLSTLSFQSNDVFSHFIRHLKGFLFTHFSGTTMFKFKTCLEKMTTQSRCLIGENGNCFDVSCDKIALRCHLHMVVHKSFLSQTPNKFEARNLTRFSLL